jgi:hypothetical protein
MAAIFGGIARQIEEFQNYWGPRVQDALTSSDQAGALNVMGLSAPRQGEPNWRTWNVQELNPEQCKLAAEFAKEQACWENFKEAALLVGGVVASVVIYAAMLFVAFAIIAHMFIVFSFIIDVLVVPIVGEGTLLFWAVFIPLDLKLTADIFNVFAAFVAIAPRLWTKELAPAIDRSAIYAHHLTTQSRRLELRAAGAVPA